MRNFNFDLKNGFKAIFTFENPVEMPNFALFAYFLFYQKKRSDNRHMPSDRCEKNTDFDFEP